MTVHNCIHNTAQNSPDNLLFYHPFTAQMSSVGATEIAEVDSVARAKKAVVENAGVDKAARRNRGVQRRSERL